MGSAQGISDFEIKLNTLNFIHKLQEKEAMDGTSLLPVKIQRMKSFFKKIARYWDKSNNLILRPERKQNLLKQKY